MRNFTLIFSLLLAQFFSCAQGFSALERKAKGVRENVKALVVGVSSYQHIRSLNYANRDAEVFADYLRNNDFWNVSDENLWLLTNENAKQGDILMGLQWLHDSAISGDDVVFYFSGHGDVEQVGEDKQGFLLAHDSPKNNYALGGTIPVTLLDSVFNDLIQRGVRLTLVVDACKSGQLAGGMSGTGQTNEALSLRWKNQVRILSAEPEQLSVEDTLWGGGHGVFTYYLVKGLSGYAEQVQDSIINLGELASYLEYNVSAQTDYTQSPVVEGPNKFRHKLSFRTEEQMQAYAHHRIANEGHFVLATKAADDVIEGDCADQYQRAFSAITSLTKDNFVQTRAVYDSIQGCEPRLTNLRYRYSRSLINEINRVLNNTLSGKQLMSNLDFVYALDLVDELFAVNAHQAFVATRHFEAIRDFLLTESYARLGDANYEEFRFLIRGKLVHDIDEAELNNFIRDAQTSYYNFREEPDGDFVLELDVPSYLSSSILNGMGAFFDGPAYMDLVFLRDTNRLDCVNCAKEEWRKLSTVYEISYDWSRTMIDRLKDHLRYESNASYLYYSLGNLYMIREQVDSARYYLEKGISASPTWLNLIYLDGYLELSEHRYRNAIESFTKVYDLQEIYQDFECLNCFYLGLISAYLNAGYGTNQLEEALLQWRKKGVVSLSTFEQYSYLLSYSIEQNDKKGMQYWSKLMHESTSYTFEDQLQLLLSDLRLKNISYSKEKVLNFVRFLISFENEYGPDEFMRFFSDSNVNRLQYSDNPIVNDYFPNGKIIHLDWSDYTNTKGEIFLELSAVVDYLITSKSTLIQKEWYEAFYLQTIIRYQSLQEYDWWLYLLKEIVQMSELREVWREYYLDGNDDADDNFWYFFVGDNEEAFFDIYYDNMGHFEEDVQMLLLGGSSLKSSDPIHKLIDEAKTYEEFDQIKEIKRKLAFFGVRLE